MAIPTPATGTITAVADMATAIIGLVQTWESSHNSPGMLQAAIAAQWQAMADSAEKAVATGDVAAVQEGVSQ